MTRFLPLLVAAALGLTAAACGIDRPAMLRNTGYSDRCADIMRQSYPEAKIEMNIKHAEVATTESGPLGLMIVDVEGVRPDIPATGFLANAVAARCRFENGILTQFRWTKGPYR